uniref:CK1 family protein kinase n=1 Tax=Coptotermes formosanus TaxID=36987 RepID=R4V2D6_COPFO|nr:CK1 family protein kinase [Coptotermes formosanus]
MAHIPYTDKKSLTGTARYASVNSLRGIEQSRRDDMESLAFVWMYLLKGTLPWMGLDAKDRKQKYQRICDVKAATSIETLCEGFPREFSDYLNEVRKLGFEEEPKYSQYRELFFQLFLNMGYTWDGVYDWTEQSVEPPSEKKEFSMRYGFQKERIVQDGKRYPSAKVTLHNTLLIPIDSQVNLKKKPIGVAPQIPNPYNEFISKQVGSNSRKNFEITSTRPRGPDIGQGELVADRVHLKPIKRNKSSLLNRSYLTKQRLTTPQRKFQP